MLSFNFIPLKFVWNQAPPKATGLQEHNIVVYPHLFFLTPTPVDFLRPNLKIIINVYGSEQKCHEVIKCKLVIYLSTSTLCLTLRYLAYAEKTKEEYNIIAALG